MNQLVTLFKTCSGQPAIMMVSYQDQTSRVFRYFLAASLVLHILFSLVTVWLMPRLAPSIPEASRVIMVSLTSPIPDKHSGGQTAQAPQSAPVQKELPKALPQTPSMQPKAPSSFSTAPPVKHNQPVAETVPPSSGNAVSRTTSNIPQQHATGQAHTDPVAGTGSAAGKQEQPQEVAFGSVSGPAFSKQALPVYPPQARRRGKEGRVLLRLNLSETGKLIKVEVLEDPGYGFSEAAQEAVRNSSFSPAHHNGKPVAVRTTLPIRFTLR